MTTETPWSGLRSCGPEARRVDGNAALDFFWWVGGRGEPGLLLILPEGIEEIRPLPSVRSLAIRYRTLPSGRALMLMLEDEEQVELFEVFCRDVMGAAERASSAADVLSRTVRRMMRWHHMLRGGAAGKLSTEEQRGLVGELALLNELADRIGEAAAVTAWRGPSGAPRDFELPGLCIEAKARRSAARPKVAVSSEDQLADIPDTVLLLRVTDVDSAGGPPGRTLAAIVAEALDRFGASASGDLLEQALLATGFDAEDDYTDLSWAVGTRRTFEVRDDFPRIVPPLPQGTGDLRYSVALADCNTFIVEDDTLAELLARKSGE